jgi:hypothetical protein
VRGAGGREGTAGRGGAEAEEEETVEDTQT